MRQVRELNVIIAGVGGQGQLFLSRIITETFLRLGVPSLVAETHGMSQRGGSVVVHVRIGNEVRAPTIPQKLADVMIGMELIEAARYVDYLRDRGVAIVNEKVIVPPGQNVKLRDTDLLAYLKEKPVELLTIKSSQRAVSLGAPLSANVHMFGAFIGLLESVEILGSGVDEVVKSVLPRRFLH
ncbi:MAG: indolepyruvate oxidoreductase subunit beta [Sulfolobales archaeon]|nr:indolepyruvate oxidoreductase subunit beta [Sulfolobales archaeon]